MSRSCVTCHRRRHNDDDGGTTSGRCDVFYDLHHHHHHSQQQHDNRDVDDIDHHNNNRIVTSTTHPKRRRRTRWRNDIIITTTTSRNCSGITRCDDRTRLTSNGPPQGMIIHVQCCSGSSCIPHFLRLVHFVLLSFLLVVHDHHLYSFRPFVVTAFVPIGSSSNSRTEHLSQKCQFPPYHPHDVTSSSSYSTAVRITISWKPPHPNQRHVTVTLYSTNHPEENQEDEKNHKNDETILHRTTVTTTTTTTRATLTRPQRKALERTKKQQQSSRRRITTTPILFLPLSHLYNTTTTTTTNDTILSSSYNDTKPLRRMLQQIQMTRNSHQLRQLVTALHQQPQRIRWSTEMDSNTTTRSMMMTTTSHNTVSSSSSDIWTRMIVTAMHCSDDILLQEILLPQWRNMARTPHDNDTVSERQRSTITTTTTTTTTNHPRYAEAVTIIRSLLLIPMMMMMNDSPTNPPTLRPDIPPPPPDRGTMNRTVHSSSSSSSNMQRNQMNMDRIQWLQYSIQEAWNILNTELSISSSSEVFLNNSHSSSNDIDTVRPVDDHVTNSVLFFRAKALIWMATFYFQQNEPLLGIQTCQLLEQTGVQWTKSLLVHTSSSSERNRHNLEHPSPQQQQQLSWIRLFQEASSCQSRIRQNNCTSTLYSSASSTLAILPNMSSSTVPSELPSNIVYSVLSARSAFPKQYNDYDNNSDRIYELISNALVRRVVFVTGAVSMAGCPPNRDNTAEVCFIGRSNVGKSSLINMVFNRKALAFTSKRPGKTQQFNFFTVNDIPDKEKEIKYGDDIAGMTGKTKDDDSFYIVDLPGFGYAKVPDEQKQKWMKFMYEYLMTRSNLRIVFHLIDSRHGPMNDDRIIMQQMATTLQNRSSDNVLYVVVLTKADKNVKGSGKALNDSSSNKPQQRSSTNSGGKVSKSIQMEVLKTMEECGINAHRTPMILTSAETKLGRDDIWRYLQIATEKKKTV